MSFELRPYSKKPNVYRLHKKDSLRPLPPGMLSYKLDATQLREIDTGAIETIPNDEIWSTMPLTEETKLRLLPITQKPADWRLSFVMKSERKNETWIKGAMVNNKTGKVTLLTAASSRDAIVNNGNRPIKSHDEHYHVGQYIMLAPIVFWNQLKNVI